MTFACSVQSAPVDDPGPTRQPGPMRQFFPIAAPAPMVTCAPTSAEASTSAAGSTTAVAWIPGWIGGAGYSSETAAANTLRGLSTRSTVRFAAFGNSFGTIRQPAEEFSATG